MPETGLLYEAEWMAALRLLQPLVTKQDLVELVTNTEFDEQTSLDSSVSVAYFRYWPHRPSGHKKITVVTHRDMRTFHSIERIEALLWVAIVAHVWFSSNEVFSNVKPSAVHQAFCRNLGVACTSLAQPEVRWRLIESAGTTSAAMLELAPWPNECVVCARPITSDEPREDIHKNCLVYARTVIATRLKEKRARLEAAELERLEQEEIDAAAS